MFLDIQLFMNVLGDRYIKKGDHLGRMEEFIFIKVEFRDTFYHHYTSR